MSEPSDKRALLAQAWSEAAAGYEQYFVPRFAPWIRHGVRAVAAVPLPAGSIVVPCCGTGWELQLLAAEWPERAIYGIDLAPEMVRWAQERTADCPHVQVAIGDASSSADWPSSCAAVFSWFGLQQLPEPAAVLRQWVRRLQPGGVLSVMFWPAVPESEGPFAWLQQVLAQRRPPADRSWEQQLAAVVREAGAELQRDERVGLGMSHGSAVEFWEAMVQYGPLRSLALAREPEFVRAVRADFLQRAPSGAIRHEPQAHWLLVRRLEGDC